MNTSRVRMIVGRLREAALPKGGGLSDGQLLGQFVARRDDAAPYNSVDLTPNMPYNTAVKPWLTSTPWQENAIYMRIAAQPSAAPSEDVKQLAAEVEAAAKKLQEKPDDKQALDELNCAVDRLRKAKGQKSDP